MQPFRLFDLFLFVTRHGYTLYISLPFLLHTLFDTFSRDRIGFIRARRRAAFDRLENLLNFRSSCVLAASDLSELIVVGAK